MHKQAVQQEAAFAEVPAASAMAGQGRLHMVMVMLPQGVQATDPWACGVRERESQKVA